MGPVALEVVALAGLEVADPAVLAPVVQADLMAVVQADPADVDLMDPVVAPVGLAARGMTVVLVANAALVALVALVAPAVRMGDAAPVGLPIRRGSWSMRWSSMRTEMAC